MVAGHSSTLQPLLSSCGFPLNFIIAFRVMVEAVAFVTATASSKPARRGVYPERKPQAHKSSCSSSLQAPFRARCQTPTLRLSGTFRSGAQTSPHTRGPHTAISGSGKRVLCPSVPPQSAPVPAGEMCGTTAVQCGPRLADRTQLMQLTGCSVPGS